MAQSINLIPQEEKQEQAKSQLIRMSTVVSILIGVAVGGISAFMFYQTQTLKGQIKAHEDRIESLRAEIKGQSDIEIVARNLDSKYKVLDNLLKDRVYYSKLMQEFKTRQPATISIDDFSLSAGNTINITGTADTYISIAQFINSLANKKFEGGTKGLEALFTSVSLNTVTTENSVNEIKFFIVVKFEPNLLKKM